MGMVYTTIYHPSIVSHWGWFRAFRVRHIIWDPNSRFHHDIFLAKFHQSSECWEEWKGSLAKPDMTQLTPRF